MDQWPKPLVICCKYGMKYYPCYIGLWYPISQLWSYYPVIYGFMAYPLYLIGHEKIMGIPINPMSSTGFLFTPWREVKRIEWRVGRISEHVAAVLGRLRQVAAVFGLWFSIPATQMYGNICRGHLLTVIFMYINVSPRTVHSCAWVFTVI